MTAQPSLEQHGLKAIPIEKLVFCLLFMLPFSATGIMLGGYILSPGVVVAMLLSVTLIFCLRSIPVCLVYFFLMISIFVVGVIARHPLHTYFFSLMAFLAVAVPILVVRLGPRSITAAIAGHSVGLAITLLIVWAEIVSRLIGLSPIVALFEQLFPYRREAMPFLGYQRPSAGFQEPAHLAMYLVFSVVFIDALAKEYRKKIHPFLRVLAVVSVFAVGSVSGIVLLVTYYLILFCKNLGKLIFRRRISKKSLVILLPVLMLAVPFFLFSSEIIITAVESVVARVDRAIDFLISLQLHRSEGSRVNAIPVMFIAWFSEGPLFLLFGTGYANSEEYLISKYGGIQFSSFAQGNIVNIFAVVGVSTGFLGLSAYLLFLRSLYVGKLAKASFGLKLMFLLLHFFTGDFISFYFWAFIFMMVVASASCRVNAYALCENSNSRSVI